MIGNKKILQRNESRKNRISPALILSREYLLSCSRYTWQ